MTSAKTKWCYECWVRPAAPGSEFCYTCEDDLDSRLELEVAGPWCAHCNLWPVSARGDLCDSCLPPQPHLPRKPRRTTVRKAPSAPKPRPIPSVADEVTYLPARRQNGVSA